LVLGGFFGQARGEHHIECDNCRRFSLVDNVINDSL
jgi:hypothetical protein